MRVVVALGGNALLRRGQPLTAEKQRANVALACEALAPIAREHELVITHGNGPQVGLLALQAAAYAAVDPYPAGRARRADRGNDRLPDRAGARQPAAAREPPRDAAHDDRGRRATTLRSRTRPSPSARSTTARPPTRLAAEKGWTFKLDGDRLRRVVPSPQPRRIFGLRPIECLLEDGCVVVCAGGGGIPTVYTRAGTAGAARGRRGA